MTEYGRTVDVAAAADEAFGFLADPENLPRYVAKLVSAERKQDERLFVAADVEGRHEEGEARFSVDPVERRMEWGGEGDRDYRGWLQVRDAEDGSSVTIHIHAASDEGEAEIRRVLNETALNIARLLENR